MFRDINSFISNFLKTRSQKGMATAGGGAPPPPSTPEKPISGIIGIKEKGKASVKISPTLSVQPSISVQPFMPREFKTGEPVGEELHQLAQRAFDSLPKNDDGIAPSWAMDIKVGDRMYVNLDTWEYTSAQGKNTAPLFYDDYNTITLDITGAKNPTPVFLTPELAQETYQFYQFAPLGLPESAQKTLQQAWQDYESLTADNVEEQTSGLSSWKIDDTTSTFWYTDPYGESKPITFTKGNVLTPLWMADSYFKKMLIWGSQPYNTQLTRAFAGGTLVGKRLLGNFVSGTLTNTFYIDPEKLRPLYEDKKLYEQTKSVVGKLKYASKHHIDLRIAAFMPMYSTHEEFKEMFKVHEDWWATKGEPSIEDASFDNTRTLLSQFWALLKPEADVSAWEGMEGGYLFNKGKYENKTLRPQNLAQASELHNQAHEIFYTTGDSGKAIELKKRAYNLQNQYGVNKNNDFAYSFLGDEKLYDQYLTAKAVIELQRGPLLNQFEMRQLQQRFIDPSVEIVGEVAFGDLSDVITLARVGKVPALLGSNSKGFIDFTTKYIGDLGNMNVTQLIYNTVKGGVKWGIDVSQISSSPFVRGATQFITQAGGLFKASSRQAAKNAAASSDLFIRGMVQGGDVFDNPQEFVSVFSKIGNDVATIKNELILNGEIASASKISQQLQEAGTYSPQLVTKERISALLNMVDAHDPLAVGMGKTAESWSDIANNAYRKALKKHEDTLRDQLSDAVNALIRNTPDMPVEEANRLLSEVNVSAQVMAKDLVRGVEVSTEISNVFRGSLLEKHRAWLGSNILDTNLSGYIGRKLGEALGDNTQGVRLYRQVADSWSNFWNLYFGAWVRNVVIAPFRFFGVYSPSENIAMYQASRGGSLIGGINDLANNSPELLKRITDMPVEARTGLTGGIFSLETEMASGGSLNLIDMLKANPTSWVATPSNVLTLFRQNFKSRWVDWLDSLSDTAGNASVLKRIRNGLGIIGMPLGAWTDTSRAISSSGELIIKATIADEKYLSNLKVVNEAVKLELTNLGADILRKGGADEMQVMAWSLLNQSNWERARGNALTYAKLMDFSLVNKASNEVYLAVPEFARKVNLGLSASETDAFLRNINENKNIAITALKNAQGEVSDEDVHKVFKEIRTVFGAGTNETLNPEGIVGVPIFGQIHTTRPVSNNTRLLLDAFEDGTLKKSKAAKIGDQTIEEILADNNVVLESGQKLQDVVEDLHNTLRPGVSAKIQFTEDGLDLIRRHKVSPNSIVKDSRYVKKATAASDELGYTDSLKKILTDHGIDIEDKPVQQALDELVSAYNDIYKLEGVPPDSASAILGEEIPVSDDVVSEMGRIHFTRPKDRGKWEDILRAKEARPDIPDTVWESKDRARIARGHLQERLRQLDAVVSASPKNVEALDLRTKINNLISNFDSSTNYMNSWLQNVYPGYIVTKSRTGYKQAQMMWEHYNNTTASLFDELTTSLTTGQSFLPITPKEYLLRMWNINMSFDATGAPLFHIKDPITNVWQEFPSMLNPEGQLVVDFRMSRLMDDSYLGITNNDVLNAPMTLGLEDIRTLQRKASVPYFSVPPERIPIEQKGFFDAMISKRQLKEGGKTFKEYIEITLSKSSDDIDAMSPDDVIKALRKKIGKRTDEAAKAVREFADLLQEGMDYYTVNFLTGNMRVIASVPDVMFADETKAWADHKLTHAASHEAVMDLLDEWEADTLVRVRDGSAFVPDPDLKVSKATDDANKAVLKRIADIEHKLWDGGVVNGISLEGAIPYMRTMMRVPEETVLDQFMRSIVPFWMFATRGSRAYMRIALDRPDWVFAYARYRRFSEASAYTHGMIDSKGRVLPSKVGKVPFYIRGQQVWVALDSPLPFFRYILTPNRAEKNDYQEAEDDIGWLEKFITYFRGEGELRGININPVLDLALLDRGIPDQYSSWNTAQEFAYYAISAFVPPDLLPPNVWNYVTSVINSLSGSDIPDADPARIKWFDPLVEVRLMEQYLMKIENEPDEKERMKLALELQDIIAQRESSDVYNQAVREVEMTDYYKKIAGWFIGIYPNPTSPAYAEILSIRNKRNLIVASLNSQLPSQIFYPDTTAADLYSLYIDDFLSAPEGQLYQVRRATSWVTDEDGNAITEKEERRKQIGITFERMSQTRTKYELIQQERDEYTLLVRSYPIGAAYKDPILIEARKKMYEAIAEIEFNPMYALAEKTWTAGIKPRELVDKHYRDMWWYLLTKSRPARTQYKNNEEYELADAVWRENLPMFAQEMIPIMVTNVIPSVSIRTDAEGNQTISVDADRLVNELVAETNADGLDKWNIDRTTSVDVAITDAWWEMYLKMYLEQANKIEGTFNKEQFYETFKATVTPPNDEQITEFILDKYGTKFTPEEIKDALTRPEIKPEMPTTELDSKTTKATPLSRERLDIDEYFELGKTPIETKHQSVWDMFMWAKPNRTTELKTAFIKLGGNMNQWNAFYDLEGVEAIPYNKEFSDEKAFTDFWDALQRAANSINLQPPTSTELGKLVIVEDLDLQLKQMVTMQLGVDFFEKIYYPYSGMTSSEKRIFVKSRPEDFAKIQQYWKMRDQYAIQYPAWAEYYTQQTGTTYYGGGGGYRRGGGRGIAKRGDQFVGMGMRATEDIQELLAGTKKLGSAGVPKWLPSGASSVLKAKLANGAELSETDIKYLKKLRDNNPELTEEINNLIGEETVA